MGYLKASIGCLVSLKIFFRLSIWLSNFVLDSLWVPMVDFVYIWRLRDISSSLLHFNYVTSCIFSWRPFKSVCIETMVIAGILTFPHISHLPRFDRLMTNENKIMKVKAAMVLGRACTLLCAANQMSDLRDRLCYCWRTALTSHLVKNICQGFYILRCSSLDIFNLYL